jgi:hypothetical protein
MVKKLKVLGTILLLSFQTFSQSDTNKVCIPYSTAKKIAIELVQKDSLQSELKETQLILKEFQNKTRLQDSVIVYFEQKEIEHKSEIKILEEKEKIHIGKVEELTKDNNKLIKKNNRLKTTSRILGGGFLGTLAALVTLIVIK